MDDASSTAQRDEHSIAVSVRGLTVVPFTGRNVLQRLRSLSSVAAQTPASVSRALLTSVDLSIPVGTVTAILGASGSGKTTLLNSLAGRLSSKNYDITGKIEYYDCQKKQYVSHAYVAQHDAHAPSLTVRETLEYAAQLRLHADPLEQRALVARLIRQLGLDLCADTRVGDGEHQGCSGGERRRLSLAVQLLSDPDILYLDEVTTGLDAAAAYQIVKLLAQLARQGKTIILTIHQPRSEIWQLFDRIVLLCEGEVIVDGPTHSCLDHLAALGHPLPQFVNPAEHLVDTSALDYRSEALEMLSRTRVDQLKAGREETARLSFASTSSVLSTKGTAQSVSWWRRVGVQTHRHFRISFRNPNVFAGSMIECLCMATLTGWIFYKLDGSLSGIRSREAALYITIVLQSYLVLLYETYRLTTDIKLFQREEADGVSDIWSFLLSRRLANILTIDIPVPLIFATIVYFMIGFRNDALQFSIFFGIILLTHLLSNVLAALAVVIRNDFAGASLMVNLNLNLQALCCGFLIQTNQIPVYVQWLKWLAYAWYATGAVVTNEFLGSGPTVAGYLYDCPFSGGVADPRCLPWTGRYAIDLLGYPGHDWIWCSTIALLCFIPAIWICTGWVSKLLTPSDTSVRSVATNERPLLLEDAATSVEPPAINKTSIAMTDLTISICKRGARGDASDVPILGPLTATLHPGKLNVIMGVSGAGKSTLLNVLASRCKNSFSRRYKCEGAIAYDEHMSAARSTAYVAQTDDFLQPNLTVRETVMFAARLRLPASKSNTEKTLRAEQVMQQLGLRSCADTLVGNDLVKGISGGERRRVSIAIALLTTPDILLLDEPTSGLDAFTASTILQVLRELALTGCTVVLTIHQPRSDQFRLFDNILLLARKGRLIYAGPGSGLLSYFASHDLKCPQEMNPADFAIDTISTTTTLPTFDQRFGRTATENFKDVPVVKTIPVLPAPDNSSSSKSIGSSRASLEATILLLERSALSLSRSQSAIIARTTQVPGFAILLTLFFAPLQNDLRSVQSHVGLIQELLAVYFIGMLQNVAIFPQEYATFLHDHEDGVSSVESFFLSYSLLALPFDVLNSVVVSLLSTYVVGLNRTVTVFGVVAYASFALISCGESVGIILNTLFKSTGFAVSIISVLLSLGLVMSGVLSTNLPPILAAINYINPARWATTAMAKYSLRSKQFVCAVDTMVDGACPIENGEAILALYNLGDTDGRSLLWLTLLVLAYRLTAYIVMKVHVIYKRWLTASPASPHNTADSIV